MFGGTTARERHTTRADGRRTEHQWGSRQYLKQTGPPPELIHKTPHHVGGGPRRRETLDQTRVSVPSNRSGRAIALPACKFNYDNDTLGEAHCCQRKVITTQNRLSGGLLCSPQTLDLIWCDGVADVTADQSVDDPLITAAAGQQLCLVGEFCSTILLAQEVLQQQKSLIHMNKLSGGLPVFLHRNLKPTEQRWRRGQYCPLPFPPLLHYFNWFYFFIQLEALLINRCFIVYHRLFQMPCTRTIKVYSF